MFTNLPIKRGPYIVSTFAFVLQIFHNTCFSWAHSLGSFKSLLWKLFHDDDKNYDLPIRTYSNMGCFMIFSRLLVITRGFFASEISSFKDFTELLEIKSENVDVSMFGKKQETISEHGRLTFDDRNLTFEIWVEFNYHPQHRFYMVLL